MGVWGPCPLWGPQAKPLIEVWGEDLLQTTLFVKMCYFEPVFKTHALLGLHESV